MASLVGNDAHGWVFTSREAKNVFFKVMLVAEELERACTSSGATSSILVEDVPCYMGKIHSKIFPLVKDEKEDYW